MQYPHGLKQPEGADGVDFGRIFRHIKRHFDMALGCEIIYLVRLNLGYNSNERRRVGHVAVVQVEHTAVVHVAHPFVEIDMFDAFGVERRAAAHDAVHLIAFFDKELGEI